MDTSSLISGKGAFSNLVVKLISINETKLKLFQIIFMKAPTFQEIIYCGIQTTLSVFVRSTCFVTNIMTIFMLILDQKIYYQ